MTDLKGGAKYTIDKVVYEIPKIYQNKKGKRFIKVKGKRLYLRIGDDMPQNDVIKFVHKHYRIIRKKKPAKKSAANKATNVNTNKNIINIKQPPQQMIIPPNAAPSRLDPESEQAISRDRLRIAMERQLPPQPPQPLPPQVPPIAGAQQVPPQQGPPQGPLGPFQPFQGPLGSPIRQPQYPQYHNALHHQETDLQAYREARAHGSLGPGDFSQYSYPEYRYTASAPATPHTHERVVRPQTAPPSYQPYSARDAASAAVLAEDVLEPAESEADRLEREHIAKFGHLHKRVKEFDVFGSAEKKEDELADLAQEPINEKTFVQATIDYTKADLVQLGKHYKVSHAVLSDKKNNKRELVKKILICYESCF
jgi:hypothetical protein